MKKKNLNALRLNKKSISTLNDNLKGGTAPTTGCTDGCGPFQTWFRCTQGFCTNDCNSQDIGGTQCTVQCPI